MIHLTCTKCKYNAPESFFQLHVVQNYTTRVRYNLRNRICLMCIQEEQDKNKCKNRIYPKARNMLKTHCNRHNCRNGTNFKSTEFAKKFGWEIDRMIHDIEHSFENSCPYCEYPFGGMEHGLSDLTLDIRDPGQPPYYNNITYCCSTCNKRKGQMGPTRWGEFLAQVKKRREFLNSKNGSLSKPQYSLPITFSKG